MNAVRFFFAFCLICCSTFVGAEVTTTGSVFVGSPPYGQYSDYVSYVNSMNPAVTICGQGNGLSWHVRGMSLNAGTVTVTCYRCDQEGEVDQGGQCVYAPCQSKTGTVASAGYFDQGTSAAGNPVFKVCQGGCAAWFSGDTGMGSRLVDGQKHYYALGQYTYTADSCTASPGEKTLQDISTMPAEDTCAAGQYKGTINGKTVCVNATQGSTDATVSGDKGTSVSSSSSSTVTNADGSKEVTTVTRSSNDEGQTSTTTVVQSYDPSGALTGTRTVTLPSQPASAAGGSGSGTPGTGSGGETDCDKHPEAAGCAEFGEPDQGPDLPHQDKTVGLSTYGSFGPSDASCPAAQTVSFLGKPIAIEFTLFCQGFQWLRPVVLAMCGLLAGVIFIGGVRA